MPVPEWELALEWEQEHGEHLQRAGSLESTRARVSRCNSLETANTAR